MLGCVSAKRARAVILHLLRGCEACIQVLLPYVPASFFPKDHEAPSPPFSLEDYDAPIDRAFALLRVRSPLGGAEIQEEAIHFLTVGGLEALVDAPPALSGLPLFEALLKRSWALRYEDPIRMVQLAHAAALLATRFNEDE